MHVATSPRLNKSSNWWMKRLSVTSSQKTKHSIFESYTFDPTTATDNVLANRHVECGHHWRGRTGLYDVVYTFKAERLRQCHFQSQVVTL